MRIFISFLFCLVVAFSNAQTEIVISKDHESKSYIADRSEACDPDHVFTIVEDLPVYIGGNHQLAKDLNKWLHFPEDLNGSLHLMFTVNCEGGAFGFQVLKGMDDKSDKSIVAVLGGLDKWNAGLIRGFTVDCSHILSLDVHRGHIKIK